MWPLCTEISVEHTRSYIRIPVWPEIRYSNIGRVLYSGFARSFTTCTNYAIHVLFAHIVTHTEQWSYYVTLVLVIVYEVFVFCFGCYGWAQYLSWVDHQTIVRAFNDYLFLMKYIFHVSNIYKLCYCCVTFVSLFINFRLHRDFTSHTSQRGTLHIYGEPCILRSIHI